MTESRSPPRSLYQTLSWLTLALLVAAGTAQYMLLYPAWNAAQLEVSARRNRGLAAEVANRLAPLYDSASGQTADRGSFDAERLLEEVLHFVRQNPAASLMLLDASGLLLADFSQSDDFWHFTSFSRIVEIWLSRVKGNEPLIGPNPFDPAQEHAFSLAPMEVLGERFYVYIALESKASQSIRNIFREGYAFAAAAAAVLLTSGATSLLGIFLLYFVTRRFSRMTTVVREYAAGNFDARTVVSNRGDELDGHALTLNRMAERIERSITELHESDRARRRLILAVSNDLTGVMQALDRTLKMLEQPASGENRSAAEAIVRQAKTISSALDELFELARIASKDSLPREETFSLEQLMDDLIMASTGHAAERGLRLERAGNSRPTLAVAGDIDWISWCIAAVIEELIERSRPGSSLTLSAEPQAERLEARFTLDGGPAADPPFVESWSLLKSGILIAKLKAHGTELRQEVSAGGVLLISFSLALQRRSES